MLRFVVPAAVFAVLVGFFFVGLGLNPAEVPSPFIGKPAPVLDVESLHDPAKRLTSAELAGRPWLLNVWGTWCVGCREEHDALLAIARTRALPIYGLAWKDDPQQALAWLDQLGDPYDAVGVDADGRVAIDWGVYGAPETFLVDAQGIVRYKHIGPLSLEIWRERFLPLIESASEPAS
jgi:cytochrome c biogenesis protein CcmG, thiol:disulfide interchange protein DsbE